jgi:hypothetical protein
VIERREAAGPSRRRAVSTYDAAVITKDEAGKVRVNMDEMAGVIRHADCTCPA